MELALHISLHVFFPHVFPGEKQDCSVPSVIATVHVVRVGGACWTMPLGSPCCGPGAAGVASSGFMPGPSPSGMPATRIAPFAATWISSGFRASTERARLPGFSACFIFRLIAALLAGTASSRSVPTGASYLRDAIWNPGQNRIPYRISGVVYATNRVIRTG
jgi:hypothetical protein